MSEDDVQYKLRLPAELHGNLSELAKANGRSLSSEIVARLQASLATSFRGDAVPTAGRVIDSVQVDLWPREVVERFEAIARKAGEVAAERVLKATGIDLVRSGTASIVQGPPPEPEGKPASRSKGREQ